MALQGEANVLESNVLSSENPSMICFEPINASVEHKVLIIITIVIGQIFSIAPAEGQKPVSIMTDKAF